jgi:beta-N-acetylhexosaminidase
VITDSLMMGALRDTYGDARIPVMASNAGDDVLLMPPSLPVAFGAVQAAVQSGAISIARLDASVRRILALKEKLGLFDAAPVAVSTAQAALGTTAHRAAEKRDAEASVTLIANDADVLPLQAPSAGEQFLVVGPGSESVDKVALMVRARGATVTTNVTGFAPRASVATAAATAAQSATTVIALTSNADTDPGQQRVVRALAGSGTPVITVAIGRPYDQGYYRAAISICLYSDSDASLRALVRALFGDINPAGKLPVAIPDPTHPDNTLYPLGYGLSY